MKEPENCKDCTKPIGHCLYCLLHETPTDEQREDRVRQITELYMKGRKDRDGRK